MPLVKGFRGWRFDPARVGSLDAVITPPYDVITEEERAALAQRSPHSMVHAILPQAEAGVSPYVSAARHLDAWIADGALRPDDAESLYVLHQEFPDATGAPRLRRGFLAVAKLPEPGERTILGHEQTFARTFEDRLCLIEATRANLGPVFLLYADPERRLAGFLDQPSARTPDLTAQTIDGVTQRLWRVPYDADAADLLRDQTLYIADGHHRFRTACAYRDAQRDLERPAALQPYDFGLMGFVALEDPGLLIFPTHRLMAAPPDFEPRRFLASLEHWFEVARVDEGLPERVASEPGCVIGVAIRGDGRYLVRLRPVDRTAVLGADHGPAWRDLDVAVLHRGIVQGALGLPADTPFTYERDAAKALDALDSGAFDLAFLLKATRSEQIRACAEAGESMPHKSTYFFPKLPSGAAIYRHD